MMDTTTSRAGPAIKLLGAAMALLIARTAFADDLAGTAHVVDGDTIEIAGRRIRLWGSDAPDLARTCRGRSGDAYECGRDAAAVLNELIRGRRVECAEKERDGYGRIVAVCRTDAGELNAALVRRGWALDYRRFSGRRYQAEEEAAKAERLGIWSGRFDLPWRWRRDRQ